MKKDTKSILLGFVLGLVVFLGASELARYSARSSAVEDLNSSWSGYKNSADKISAIIKADTIIGENQSLFSFSNSSADGGAEEYAYFDGGDVWGWMERSDGPQPQVETFYVVYNPETGDPMSGDYESYFEVRPRGGK